MRAVRVAQFGGPKVLKVQSDVPIPQPDDNQILVKVKACGINPIDTYIRNGTFNIKPPLPYTPGMDTAGVVEKVGPGVSKFKPGDRVYSVRTVTGGYAEYALVEDPYVAKLPETLTFEQGAAIGTPYYTAYKALVLKAHSRPGETVLIHGASGGVGVAACQIARALGMRVLGTAGTPDGMAVATKSGAHMVFNHREEGYLAKITDATGDRGPDVILEMLANVNMENDWNIIKPRGRIVIIGSRGKIEATPQSLMDKECIIIGVQLLTTAANDWFETHSALHAGMEQGWLKPHIGKNFSLEDAKLSHEEVMKDSGHTGKVILKT